MNLCKCEGSHKVDTIGSWDGCPLKSGGHTSFIVHRCLDCGGISGFPGDNLELALAGGTEATKKKLAEIIGETKQVESNIRGGPCPKGGNHEWGTDGAHSNKFCKKCFGAKAV